MEIMIVIFIIGLLVAVAAPNASKILGISKARACQMNLKQIEMAKRAWEMASKKADTGVPTAEDIRQWLDGEKMPSCPSGGTYTIGSLNVKAVCSVHDAVDAEH